MNNYNQILIELLNEVKTWPDLKLRLEKYNTVKTKTTTKKTTAGNIFEYFAKYYFLTEPTQTELFKNVWLYSEIPLDISKSLNFPQLITELIYYFKISILIIMQSNVNSKMMS